MARVLSTVTVIIFLASVPARARDYEVDLQIDSLEDLYDLEASGDLGAESLEILEALYQRPLSINRADRFLLYDLPDVTYALADAIVAYRTENGAYSSLEDLAAVQGMTREILASLAPFATAGAGGELAMADTTAVQGDARLGSILRQGFGREQGSIDALAERERGPEAYLRARGTGLTYLGAGALLTFRRRTDAWWDYSRGSLVSDGPAGMVDADTLYLFAGYGEWSVILGSYTAGFGERLTFDTTTRAQPHGWYENDAVTQDNESGAVGSRSGQFGLAATMHGTPAGGGWLDATVFGSCVRDDLYQYDFHYGHDPWYGTNGCDTDGDCPNGYACREDHTCASSRIYDADDLEAPSFRYETHRDAYDERLLGANATYNLDNRSHIGVTAYYAATEFNLARDADPAFAYSARMPRRYPEFGAVGVDARLGIGMLDMGAEYARTTGNGNATYLRAVMEPADWARLTVSGRYYDAAYLNPHARPRAQPDELFGLAGRNEVGGRVGATFEPAAGLSLLTTVDLWGNPWIPVFNDQGGLRFRKRGKVPLDLFAFQRVTWGFTSRDEVALVLEYRNKDLSENSRAEAYDLGDACDDGISDSSCGRGESRKVRVRLSTTRIPRVRLWVSYTAAWEDVRTYDDRFDLQHHVRGHASVRAWPGARWVAHVGVWLHEKDLSVDNPDGPSSDRVEPRLSSYLELQQRIDGGFAMWARYGLIHYADDRPERYAWYHLAKLTLEARF